jgi:hypothetical protein
LVAFVTSIVITLVMVGVAVVWGRRRPVGAPLSWGEAMGASVYVFFAAFMAFGVVPHQWLAYADNELSWRKDAIIAGPGSHLLPKVIPFSVTKETMRDIVVVAIYAVGLSGLVAAWAWWNKRGRVKPAPAALVTSTYGRPLVRKG